MREHRRMLFARFAGAIVPRPGKMKKPRNRRPAALPAVHSFD
jgi:hypothetical protein